MLRRTHPKVWWGRCIRVALRVLYQGRFNVAVLLGHFGWKCKVLFVGV